MKTVLYQNADWIITMDEERRRYRHADLLISGKEIKAIGKNLKDTLGDTVTIDEVVDASGRVILPGFVITPGRLLSATLRPHRVCGWSHGSPPCTRSIRT